MISPATKTPLLKHTLGQLAEFNDQLCYFTFADEEFERQLARVNPSQKDLYTSEVFEENAKAHRIQVRIKDLSAFRHATKSATFGAFASTSYETVAVYMDEALSTFGRMKIYPSQVEKNSPIEARLQSAMKEGNCGPVDRCVFEALTYLRLRRNHIIHLSSEPTSALKTLVKQRGAALNKYWTSRAALDFSRVQSLHLSESEAIAFINLLRACVHELDKAIAAVLDPLQLLRDLDAALITEQPGLKGEQGYERRAKKLRYRLKALYGVECSQQEISQALWQQ